MHAIFLVATLVSSSTTRTEYGVPVIRAATEREAFVALGRATAEDRLWQMEMSRRTFRGQLAEVAGLPSVASDMETLLTCYREKELQGQVEGLSKAGRDAFYGYAEGVNQAMQKMQKDGTLPSGYATMGFEPRPWTVIDSAAIATGMAKRFGGGGAGEIRNLLAYSYLSAGKRTPDQVLDILDDMLWQNVPESIPTLDSADDRIKKMPSMFPASNRAVTESHLASLPRATVPELLPGIRLASMEQQSKAAQKLAVLFKTGSYAILVHGKRSATGENLLLSGPQMGHSAPSIVYEARIESPTLNVQGITVPGVPQVVVGNTPNFAWGLTTGVADTTDVFFNKRQGDQYEMDGQWKDFSVENVDLKIKGEPTRIVTRLRTVFGPVVSQSPTTNTVFSLKASYAGQELRGFDEILAMQRLASVRAVLKHSTRLPLGFNLFVADRKDIGYAYCGLMPRRAATVDMRFPTPGQTATSWKGVVPLPTMIQVLNPKSGLLVNWNNKPVSWFPNLDTPAWGEIFRNELLVKALPAGKLAESDLVAAIRKIAQQEDETQLKFLPQFLAAAEPTSEISELLRQIQPTLQDGSRADATYRKLIERLRHRLFVPVTGNFLQPEFFRLAVQPSVIWRAMAGRTKTNFLGDRTAESVLKEVLAEVSAQLPTAGSNLSRINYGLGDQDPLLSNRGTFIQMISQGKQWSGQTVLGPGNTATGTHSKDQVDFVRNWRFKPILPWQK